MREIRNDNLGEDEAKERGWEKSSICMQARREEWIMTEEVQLPDTA